jgi:peptidoglycan hydrolase-like protein with peptidoglycan-binding domain
VHTLDEQARSGSRVDRLLRYLALPAKHEGDRVVLVTWSGGYPIALWAMTDPALDGVVWLDSGHAAEVAPGTPDPARIASAVEYAKRAHGGERLFWMLHSDIDPIRYSSTTEVARAIVEAAGGEGGLLHVERYPGATARDHIEALTTDGPPFVANAIRALLAYQDAAVTPIPSTPRSDPLRRGDRGDAVRDLQALLLAADHSPGSVDGIFGPKTEAAVKGFQRVRHFAITGEADAYTLDALRARGAAPVTSHEGLGMRALRIALEEAAKGVHETPWGSNRSPEIDAYQAPAGMRGEPWCELFESWCRRQALLPGEVDPLGYHAAVAAFWRAAVKAGKSRPITYRPKVGDAAIFRRFVNGHWHDPTRGGYGHVGRVQVPPMVGAKWVSIDGNVRDRVDVVEHDSLADVVGWVEM